MCEWLKQSVLKTDVRETVPGVRIPLPPPRQSGLQRNSSYFLQKMREIARFLRFTSGKPYRRKRPAKRSSKRLRPFSLEGTNPVRFRRGVGANAMRSQMITWRNRLDFWWTLRVPSGRFREAPSWIAPGLPTICPGCATFRRAPDISDSDPPVMQFLQLIFERLRV